MQNGPLCHHMKFPIQTGDHGSRGRLRLKRDGRGAGAFVKNCTKTAPWDGKRYKRRNEILKSIGPIKRKVKDRQEVNRNRWALMEWWCIFH